MRLFNYLAKKYSLNKLIFIEILVGLEASIISLALFIFFTDQVLEKEVLFYDRLISGYVYTLRTPILTNVMYGITFFTSTVPAIILTLIVIAVLFKKYKKEALIFLLSLALSSTSNYLLKIVFGVSRPDISPLQNLHDNSYPSGHAMNNLMLYGLLAFYSFHFTRNRLFSILVCIFCALWVGLIGFSRIYLGEHYPSDVIAGYLMAFWLLTTVFFIDKTIGLFNRKHGNAEEMVAK